MNTFTSTGFIPLAGADARGRNGHHTNGKGTETNGFHAPPLPPVPPPDPEILQKCAWEIGADRAADRFTPTHCHISVGMMAPTQGYLHWRILPEWIDQTAQERQDVWQHSRMIVRIYDVSCILFNGFNAHRFQDHAINHLTGHLFFKLPGPGTTQLAEVGFVLRNGEFVAAARSAGCSFAAGGVSSHGDHAALFVNNRLRIEEIHNLWDQERILIERSKPRLRDQLRIACFSFESLVSGQEGMLARYVSELASGQCTHGHEVHVFVPGTGQLKEDRQIGQVHYHPLPIPPEGTALDMALAFVRAAEQRLQECPPFDLFHLCEWMTGMAPWLGTRPTVLSLGSIEAQRRNGTAPTPLSLEIQRTERELAHQADCILTPDWLRDQAIADFGIDGERVHAFPMEARILTEWECPLDYGQVKSGIGVGPLDRLVLYIGPLEYDAGVDLLIEAMPTVLRRAPNARLGFVGLGGMYDSLQRRAHELGVGYAIRMLGHRESTPLARLLRASEALLLPSRRRVHQDETVIDLARRAGRPVVTTHGGPSHLVKHEETGLLTYDNPGSMVWAFDRILSDPYHAERMGQKGRRNESGTISWAEAAARFLELCANCFPELRKVD